MTRAPRVAIVSTYPPRQCGLATFSQDLFHSIREIPEVTGAGPGDLQVVAMDTGHYRQDYPPEVRIQVRANHWTDYREAAELLNLSPADVVSLQHEYGIFGGENGNLVIYLLKGLKKPVVTTLHTVLEKPTAGQRETLKTICGLSTLVVAQASKAVDILVGVFDVPRDKILLIPHGTPDVPFLDPAFYKHQCGTEGRRVVLTFGLISPNKGIEYAIEAMSLLVREFPDLLYIVLGATHPEVKKRYGESYRLSLERLVKERGLEDNVVFHNRFVSREQLLEFLVSADIYLTPYLAQEQIVSGTLAYAVACGKAVMSTPYLYAQELLADGRGVLVPFRNPEAMAEGLRSILSQNVLRDSMRSKAYAYGRKMTWPVVARSYMKAFEDAFRSYGPLAAEARRWVKPADQPSLPEVNLAHLRTLTDEVGLLQHACFSTPDRIHGYSTDDVARALLVSTMNWRLMADEAIWPFLQTYMAFVNHAIDPRTGRVRNFMSYDRRWTEEVGSDDCHGRTLWALGYCVHHLRIEPLFRLATRLFNRVRVPAASITSPRASAYIVLGCIQYLKHFAGDTEARALALSQASHLASLLKENSSQGWTWFEDIVSYDNGRLPQALIAAGAYLKDEAMLQGGLAALDWLLEMQTDPVQGHISLVGSHGWYRRGRERARFDQQPVEIPALMDACNEAFRATGEGRWISAMERCFSWFLGRNDVHSALYDFSTGGCFDGIHHMGVNQNQGGESTVSWLMSLHRMHLVHNEQTVRATAESNGEVAATRP